MQVNLLSVPDAALICARGDGGPLAALGATPDRSLEKATDELREAVRRDERQQADALATLLPTGPAEVINEAERNVARSSRAFRRQAARQDAAEQFQHDRQGFRQALTRANQRGSPTTARQAAQGGEPAEASATAKCREASSGSSPSRASEKPAGDAASTSTATDAKPAASGQVGETGTTPARTSAVVRPLPAASAASTSNATSTAPVRVMSGSMAAARVASLTATQSARSAGTATAKASGTAVTAANAARGTPKTGMPTGAKAGGPGAAQNASREANIERIVRVVRQRISGQRAQTVVRLDPPELGSLRLELDLRGSALRLRVDTSTVVAHRLLSEDLHKLRDGLEASGIQLERVEIRPPTITSEAAEQETSQQADAHQHTDGESAEPGAEHPEEQGRDSRPADPTSGTSRGTEPEPAAESLVNLIA